MEVPAPSCDLHGVHRFKPRKTRSLLGAQRLIDQALTHEIPQNHILEEKESREPLTVLHVSTMTVAGSACSTGAIAMCIANPGLTVDWEGETGS